MTRQPRTEFSGAIYPVMKRGDRREPIFRDDPDHKKLFSMRTEVCPKTDGQNRTCVQRGKGAGRKRPIARRLRTETGVTLKWIAAELRWREPRQTTPAPKRN